MKITILITLLGLVFATGCASGDRTEATTDHDWRMERMSHDRAPRGL